MRASKFLMACAFALAAACGGGSSDDAIIEKSVVIMEEMGAAIDGAGDDCGKMATSLEGVLKKHEGDLNKLKEMKEKLKEDKAAKEKMAKAAEKYKDRMKAVMPKMMGMMKCGEDPKMKELNEKFKALR